MTLIVFLFLLGVLMLSLEIFLPGGILGVLGGLIMVGGVVLAFRDFGTGGGMVALTVGIVLGTGAIVAEFVVLPRTRWGQRMYLSAAITGVSSPEVGSDSLVGRPCEALTVLAPTGVVLLDGQKYEAFCRDGYAERGTPLIIRGRDSFRLIVSKS